MNMPVKHKGQASHGLGLRCAGLTLVEILVAVSVLGVMASLAYGGIIVTIRSQRRAEAMQELSSTECWPPPSPHRAQHRSWGRRWVMRPNP